MADHRLLTNAFSAGSVQHSLFQSPAFFQLHGQGQGCYFEWADGQGVDASVHFTPCGGEGLWRSPARGTFAGFSVAPGLRTDALFAFHDAVEAALRERGARQAEVLPAPMAHDPVGFANELYLLRSRGYQMSHCDLNHSLEVDARPLAERMTYGNLKRLRKCAREGLVAEQLPLAALPAVYDTLAANRASKGHTLSMSLPQLQAMAEVFPAAMLLFGCQAGDGLAASALCLQLSPAVLYVFYWGDQPGYAAQSPVVAVAEAIYRYCQAQQLRVLDVGTSTLNEAPNPGLIQFKRGLGFTESLKVRMCKTL